VTLSAPGDASGRIFIVAASGGNGDNAGGKGGTVSGVTATGHEVNAVAGGGGDGVAGNAPGGAGGAISGLALNVNGFARLIRAGDGGSAAGTGLPGAGGSISGVTVSGSGAIGYDLGSFAVSFAPADMGGLVVGLSDDPARNGSINGVTATSIAALLAGAPAANAISASSAVNAIAGLLVSGHLGADVNSSLTPTDSTSATWAGFADPNNLVDGIVIIRNIAANLAAVQARMIAPGFLFAV
jgi:hypothetical protein